MPTVLRIELTITPKPININHQQQKSLMDTREQVKHLHFKLLFGRTNKDHIKSSCLFHRINTDGSGLARSIKWQKRDE